MSSSSDLNIKMPVQPTNFDSIAEEENLMKQVTDLKTKKKTSYTKTGILALLFCSVTLLVSINHFEKIQLQKRIQKWRSKNAYLHEILQQQKQDICENNKIKQKLYKDLESSQGILKKLPLTDFLHILRNNITSEERNVLMRMLLHNNGQQLQSKDYYSLALLDYRASMYPQALDNVLQALGKAKHHSEILRAYALQALICQELDRNTESVNIIKEHMLQSDLKDTYALTLLLEYFEKTQKTRYIAWTKKRLASSRRNK